MSDLSLFVNNALDSQPVLQHRNRIPGDTLFYATTFRPRTVGLTANWRFGEIRSRVKCASSGARVLLTSSRYSPRRWPFSSPQSPAWITLAAPLFCRVRVTRHSCTR